MNFPRFFALFSSACTLLFVSSASVAQSTPQTEAAIAKSGVPREAVAVVVNDSVISTYDVRQRMRLMLLTSGGRIPQEALPQLQQQAMRDLIQEKLKLLETAEYDMTVSAKELEQELAVIASQSGIDPTRFEEALASEGVSISTLKQQVQASMLWPQLVQGRYRDRVRVNADEVDETLVRMREEANMEQFLISEICIPVADPSQAQQYYEGSLQLLEQMRQGVPFTVVAQQFSACTTAALGGDLGWVRAGELPTELDTAIRELPPGSVTNPIPSEGAFMILAVRDKRAAVVPGEQSFTIAYASAPESIGETAARAGFDKLSVADVCSGRELRVDLGKDIGFALIENATLDQIDDRFGRFIEDLGRGDTSPVIKEEGAFHAAYICDKDEGLGLPSREMLESRISQRQLERLSQQYIRDLERDATIDIRLKEPIGPNG
ncbi:MAG: chaperone SurA [Hyphococcus sp.]|nr:MAG: chaperone SurA [Marinicaulis sp.]